MKIEAGIFDVGGVLHTDEMEYVEEDIRKTLQIDNEHFEKAYKSLTPLLGLGQIDEEEYWRRFLAISGSKAPLPDESLFLREYGTRYSVNEDVIDIVKKLKTQGLRLAVLSNTIAPHVVYNTFRGIYDLFDVKVFSNEVGLRKPDPKIFQLTLDRLNATPQDTFFVDDREDYLVGAQTIGINTILFQGATQLRQKLKENGLKV